MFSWLMGGPSGRGRRSRSREGKDEEARGTGRVGQVAGLSRFKIKWHQLLGGR